MDRFTRLVMLWNTKERFTYSTATCAGDISIRDVCEHPSADVSDLHGTNLKPPGGAGVNPETSVPLYSTHPGFTRWKKYITTYDIHLAH